MLKPIEFDAHFGNDIRGVIITQIDYTGGDHWHVYINGIEVATIFYRMGEYYYHDDDLNAEDCQAIVDTITYHLKQPYQQIKFYWFAPRSEAFKKAIAPLIA